MGKRTEYFRAYRKANKEKLNAHHRAYHQNNKEKCLSRQKGYRDTNREWLTARQKQMRELNPKKYQAWIKTSNALQLGHISKLPCEVCGNVESEAHHEDYNKPFEIKWLCKKHHAEHHRNNKENTK